MSAPPNPPFPAYGGGFTPPAYTAVAPPRYGQALRPNAEGLLMSSGRNCGYPGAPPGYARFSPLLPNAAPFHGAPANHAYAARGPHNGAAFNAAPQGHAYAAQGLPDDAAYYGAPPSHTYAARPPNVPAFNGGHAYAAPSLSDDAAYHGAPPSHGYAAPGLPDDARFHGAHQGHAYAAPGLPDDAAFNGAPPSHAYAAGFHSASPSHARGLPNAALHLLPGTPGFQAAPRGHARGLNPRARSFEGSGSGLNPGAIHEEARQDAGRPLNSGAGQLAHPIVLRPDAFATGKAKVREVWRGNCSVEFENIKDLIANWKGTMFIAIDLEYLAHSYSKTKMPFTPEEWYDSLQRFVNSGSAVQLGLAFASEKENSDITIYEVNFLVDVDGGSFNDDAVKFLEDNKHKLERHKTDGILPEWVTAGLLRFLPFGNDNVIWIAYHGDRDFAFTMRLLEGGGGSAARLPSSLGSFLYQFRLMFPSYFDVRVLAQLVEEGFRGKLTTLADDEHLKLERSGGEHHAGSDALLTLQCFGKIVQMSAIEGVRARKGLLSGIEEIKLPITCHRHVKSTDVNMVDVYEGNFDQEACLISQTIESNFSIVGLQVVASPQMHSITEDYPAIRAAASEIDSFEIQLTFMNLEGHLAFGRAWTFYLKVKEGDGTRINPLRLAALLASSRSSHNINACWVTYRGQCGLACLMGSFVSPQSLPVSLVQYNQARSNVFPRVYDIKADTALKLGLAQDASDVVTILRCYYTLRSKGIIQG